MIVWSSDFPLLDFAEICEISGTSDTAAVVEAYGNFGINITDHFNLHHVLLQLSNLLRVVPDGINDFAGQADFDPDFSIGTLCIAIGAMLAELLPFVPPEVMQRQEIVEKADFSLSDLANANWEGLSELLGPMLRRYSAITRLVAGTTTVVDKHDAFTRAFRATHGDQAAIYSAFINLVITYGVLDTAIRHAIEVDRADEVDFIIHFMMIRMHMRSRFVPPAFRSVLGLD